MSGVRASVLVLAVIAVLRSGVAWSQVNEPPILSVPSSVAALEDAATAIGEVSVSDPEDGILDVQLSASEGTVVPSNVVGTP